eukprot:g20862.t1
MSRKYFLTLSKCLRKYQMQLGQYTQSVCKPGRPMIITQSIIKSSNAFELAAPATVSDSELNYINNSSIEYYDIFRVTIRARIRTIHKYQSISHSSHKLWTERMYLPPQSLAVSPAYYNIVKPFATGNIGPGRSITDSVRFSREPDGRGRASVSLPALNSPRYNHESPAIIPDTPARARLSVGVIAAAAVVRRRNEYGGNAHCRRPGYTLFRKCFCPACD